MNRGKFKSLVLINWNGFFAQKFDLDDSITTLSGGNGAGKSTTMAAFITALIADLSLLHFRNTTEAGSTTSSHDKGLYGKLRPGTCYAVLECINSNNVRVLVGVRLVQLSGRDKKVELKHFTIHGLSKEINSIEVFLERTNNNKAKVLDFKALKDKFELDQNIVLKQYSSITDYHKAMFDYGFLPKRLISSSERKKFYKLIEASLYGGISSAITKSLRDYLLPDNLDVRKAFENMESAMRENRSTLNAINATKKDRDLFKTLVNTSIQYVSSDYMRFKNDRKDVLVRTLNLRKEYHNAQKNYINIIDSINDFDSSYKDLSEIESDLSDKLNAAQDYYNVVRNSLNVQQEIDELEVRVNKLLDNIEEQQEIYEEAVLKEESVNEELMQINEENESVRNQLSDIQTSINERQTRGIQYKQAIAKLSELNKLINKDISVDQIHTLLEEYESNLKIKSDRFLKIKTQYDLQKKSQDNLNKAISIIRKIYPDSNSSEYYNLARNLVESKLVYYKEIEDLGDLKNQLSKLYSNRNSINEKLESINNLQQQIGVNFSSLDEIQEMLEEQIIIQESIYSESETNTEDLHNAINESSLLKQINSQLNHKVIPYYKSLDDYSLIANKLDKEVKSIEELRRIVIDLNKSILDDESSNRQLKDKIDKIREEISNLHQRDINSNSNLNYIAQQVDGILLSSIYDDIKVEDASYYSALYGEYRDAIIVRSLVDLENKLHDLKDLPEDIYFIEADYDNFDENIFDSYSKENGILVKNSNNKWRFSTFSEATIFGVASRENRIKELEFNLEVINQDLNESIFNVESKIRLRDNISNYLTNYSQYAFINNPEDEIKENNRKINELSRIIDKLKVNEGNFKSKLLSIQNKINLLNRLSSIFISDFDVDFDREITDISNKLNKAEKSKQFIDLYGKDINELSKYYEVLLNINDEELSSKEYEELNQELSDLNKIILLLSDLKQRIPHFSYKEYLSEDQDEQSDNLRRISQGLSNKRKIYEDELKSIRALKDKEYKILADLKSNYQANSESLNKKKSQINDLDLVKVDESIIENSRLRVEKLNNKLSEIKDKINQLKANNIVNQNQKELIENNLEKTNKDYRYNLALSLDNRKKWLTVKSLIKDNNLERRLYRPEYLTEESNNLRTISDKAFGILRGIVDDNEYLRDELRVSEGGNSPNLKVSFFISMYDHLRERIRQDILKTDDPIEAIEQMEVELNRLYEQLSQREESLNITSDKVANIIEEAIIREKNRINKLNKGLVNVRFGQITSVRLDAIDVDRNMHFLFELRIAKCNHPELFTNDKSFSESLGDLYKKLNPDLDLSRNSSQVIGETLLDYRNYLNLGISICKGDVTDDDAWYKAESGSLSTGEAIGTGMSILLMVIQSWENESKRFMSSRDMLPCRLLFLDEAARLDAKSIATLFDLCERLDMQLLIAAPDNISPDNGTTYKLRRANIANKEVVQVVGLRGFDLNQ